jgi:hypothetical protein
MTEETGGFAFPQPNFANLVHPGMSLRDYLAAKAMQAIISNPNSDGYPEDYAKWAYQQADAMLEVRK